MHEYFRKSDNKPKPEWADKSLFFAKSRMKMCHHSKNIHAATQLSWMHWSAFAWDLWFYIGNNHLGPTTVKVKLEQKSHTKSTGMVQRRLQRAFRLQKYRNIFRYRTELLHSYTALISWWNNLDCKWNSFQGKWIPARQVIPRMGKVKSYWWLSQSDSSSL